MTAAATVARLVGIDIVLEQMVPGCIQFQCTRIGAPRTVSVVDVVLVEVLVEAMDELVELMNEGDVLWKVQHEGEHMGFGGLGGGELAGVE